MVFDCIQSPEYLKAKYGRGHQNEKEINKMSKLFGQCLIEVPQKPIYNIMMDEVLTPFHLFQYLSIWLLVKEDFISYAIVIAVITFYSICIEIYEGIESHRELQETASYRCSVVVIRENKEFLISSDKLVPGDLVIIPQKQVLPCDMVLMSGQCVVNESMLTGESYPVIKTPLQKGMTSQYNPIKHKTCTLYGGTEILQTIKNRNDAFNDTQFLNNMSLSIDDRIKTKTTGLVVRVGFQTLKGGLIKDILFNDKYMLEFIQECQYFVFFMIILALIGFCVTIPSFIKHHFTTEATILRFLDLVTTAVPPALPAVLTSGIVYSIARLRSHKIFCTSPTRLNICGILKTIVFDKTGTLTEEGLQVLGHRCVYKNFENKVKFTQLSDDIMHHSHDMKSGGTLDQLKYAMACCQSTKIIGDKLIGNPIDIKIFEFIGWEQEEVLNNLTGYVY